MKKHLLVLVVCLLTNVAFAQNVDLSQLKQQWKTEGQEDVELSYLDEKPYTGKVFAKHSNGKIGLVGEYNNGKKEGTWTYWYSTGEKKRISTYSNNKKEGTTYYWHPNGQVAKEITYRNDRNIDQKLWDNKGNRLKNPTFESFK